MVMGDPPLEDRRNTSSAAPVCSLRLPARLKATCPFRKPPPADHVEPFGNAHQVILAVGKSRREVEAIVKEDPFYEHGLADFRIIEFRASQRADDIQKRIESS